MIQITNVGTFGRRVGAKVVPTTAADGPFETDKATEAMLVAQGVAEYVDPTAAAANASQTQQAAAPVSSSTSRSRAASIQAPTTTSRRRSSPSS